ncbi:phage major capsid protein [Cryobacterium psychrophilum]|uniref:Phage major capsid protein n=1 Tax=Cryobacterium psychrophilum TaxID=41988 RepID=A0A4Y8KPM9_9MICO|nr:phage major capsid protein [Cryobacterium psychrophilum]TFD80541.1 phage major capsid protein [Cryobacterium psychrophilum]
MAVSSITAPELTAEQVQSILVKPLELASTFLAAGPRIFDTDGSPVRVPKMGAPTSTAWYGENEQIVDTDVEFDEVVLLPSTMKSVKSLTRFSNELARQSVISLDAAIKERLVTDVATKLDTAFYAGAVSTTTPTGIFNYAGTQSISTTAAVTFDNLLDAWALALGAGANIAGMKWVMRPETFVALRKIKDTSNRYQLTPDPSLDGVFRLFGGQVVITDKIPFAGTGATRTTQAALVDFSQIAVARDLAPSVKILDQTFGDFDQQAIRVVARYDAQPLNPQAIVKITGLVTPTA